eukprot:gene17510-biopygen15911
MTTAGAEHDFFHHSPSSALRARRRPPLRSSSRSGVDCRQGTASSPANPTHANVRGARCTVRACIIAHPRGVFPPERTPSGRLEKPSHAIAPQEEVRLCCRRQTPAPAAGGGFGKATALEKTGCP